MHFVQFTLNPPAAVVAAAFGSFSAGRAQEVVVARQGGALELLRPDEATGRLATVASTATFSCVRALCAVRPTGAATDDVVTATLSTLGDAWVFVSARVAAPGRVLVLFRNDGPDVFDAPPGILRAAVSKFA